MWTFVQVFHQIWEVGGYISSGIWLGRFCVSWVPVVRTLVPDGFPQVPQALFMFFFPQHGNFQGFISRFPDPLFPAIKSAGEPSTSHLMNNDFMSFTTHSFCLFVFYDFCSCYSYFAQCFSWFPEVLFPHLLLFYSIHQTYLGELLSHLWLIVSMCVCVLWNIMWGGGVWWAHAKVCPWEITPCNRPGKREVYLEWWEWRPGEGVEAEKRGKRKKEVG